MVVGGFPLYRLLGLADREIETLEIGDFGLRGRSFRGE